MIIERVLSFDRSQICCTPLMSERIRKSITRDFICQLTIFHGLMSLCSEDILKKYNLSNVHHSFCNYIRVYINRKSTSTHNGSLRAGRTFCMRRWEFWYMYTFSSNHELICVPEMSHDIPRSWKGCLVYDENVRKLFQHLLWQ